MIGYLFSEGIKSIFKQKKMSGASIIIMCATMFMFGVFFLIGENINYVMDQVQNQQGIRVILKEELTDDEINDIKVKINSIEGVNEVKFNSKQDALATVKLWFQDHQDLLEGYDEQNPFPASYFVTLTKLDLNESVQSQILKIDGVDEITSNNETISKLDTVAKTVRIITIILLALLIIISIFIIVYTIKLTVYARRREISIMKYVGATNSFIRTPFIVEGVIIGIVSALITILIVGLAYNGVLNKLLASTVIQRLTITLYSFGDLFVKMILTYLGIGVGIGVLGSSISMRKYLKV